MTVLDHSGISWSTARPEENASFVAFVDACFGRPQGRSLRREFPAALDPLNHRHHFVGRVGQRMVCAATALVRDWVTSAGTVRAAAVGCFSTDAVYRGQGLSARLQEQLLHALASEGVQWAVLWTDQPGRYAGRGFVACGRERHGALESVIWPRPERGQRVRRVRLDDAPALLELHRLHPWRVERTLEDVGAHLDPGCSEVLVLEQADQIRAYAGIGKGEDFPGYVADFAGSPEHVHVLWGLAQRGGARAVLLPAGSDSYLCGSARAMRGFEQPAGMVRQLAGGPDPRRCEWAVGGFDSA